MAVSVGLLFLAVMLFSIISKGYTAFWQTAVTMPVTFDEKVIDPGNKRATDPDVLVKANYPVLARDALIAKLGINPDDKATVNKLKGFLSDSVRVRLRDTDKLRLPKRLLERIEAVQARTAFEKPRRNPETGDIEEGR